MPVIQFDGPVMTREQKAELGQKLTRAAKEVLNHIAEEAFVVVIRENSLDNYVVGGVLVSERN